MVVPSSLEFKNHKAWVEVDGTQLPCYAILVDKKENTASCWIASEESKCFSVKLTKEEEKHSIQASLFFDGKKVINRYVKKETLATINFHTIRTSDTTKRPFKFAQLEVTDDDRYLDAVLLSRDNVQKIGEITVEVHRVTRLKFIEKPKNKKQNSTGSASKDPTKALQVHKVHESSQKANAIQHQIGYGEEVVRRGQTQNNDSKSKKIRYDGVKELIARFTFRYRPIETLRACGIVPRSITYNEVQPSQEQESLLPSGPDQISQTSVNQAQPSREAQSLLPSQPNQEESRAHNRPAQQSQETDRDSSVRPDQEVHNRHEDEKYLTRQPSPNETIDNEDKYAHMLRVQPNAEETKPELSNDEDYEDENDEEIKALQLRTERLLEEKRKRREAKEGPRKRVKREEAPMVFFRPGEVNEVIDLTI